MLHLLLALQLAAQLVPPPAHCVFYREWAYNGITYHASIRIDGTAPVYKLHNGRYWSIDVAPGTHRIYADRLTARPHLPARHRRHILLPRGDPHESAAYLPRRALSDRPGGPLDRHRRDGPSAPRELINRRR